MGKKVLHEIKAILLGSLYFLSWFGILVLIKWLLLQEYNIDFGDVSKAVVGALVVTKVALILDSVHFRRLDSVPVIVDVLLRTLIYTTGVVVVMILERSFEARHEFGGFIDALLALDQHVNLYHFALNIICVFGALLLWNFGHSLNRFLAPTGIKGFLGTRVSHLEKE